MKMHALFGLLPLVLSLPLAGCGGGGGGEAQLSQKTATITFAVMSTAMLPSPIAGIHITAQLPAGVTVTTEPTNPRQIADGLTGIKTNGSIPFGRYSATTRQVIFDVIDASSDQAGIGLGDFARLTCTITPGMTLSPDDFTIINNPLPNFKSFGFDAVAGNTVDLTGRTKPVLKVTFGL